MCGFAGIINSEKEINAGQLNKAASKVSFRGPDSCRVRILNDDLIQSSEGRNAVFFNRLAILDLDVRSDQPFENDRFLLIFNGEIYNYREIKEDLQKEGFVFHTTSDTEVLFFALQRWGKDVLPRLNGMFAFFFLDKKEKYFLLSRDRVGIKPLYYKQDGASLSFGSELHSIVRLSDQRNTISKKAVDMYLWMQYVPTPYTIIEGVHKLPPGNFLEGNFNQLNEKIALQPKAYWDAYNYVAQAKSGNSADLEKILKESLERQLHADVPLGLFLSSGIDSSLLAATVNKYFTKGQDVNFFTVAFSEDTAADESTDAKDFIRGFNNPHLINHTLEIDADYLHDHIRELYDYYDEPFGDYASLLNWIISKKAREHVTVAISGDGADELFWGYPRYNKWQQMGKMQSFPGVSLIAGSLGRLMPESDLKYKLMMASQSNPVKRHIEQFLPAGLRFFLEKPITQNEIWALNGINKIADRTDLPGILDIRTYLADAMLYKVDRASMASSLEVRVPYLDNEMIEFGLSLPLSDKSNSKFQNKAVLKELLLKLAPHYDINRPKKGFSFPLKQWLQTKWKDQVLAAVTAQSLTAVGLEPKPYLEIVNDFYKKDTHYATDVWYLYNLMLWKESFDSLIKSAG